MNLITASPPLRLVAGWPTRSQERARRNAMAACTVLEARRLERLEVQHYVAGCLARRNAAETEPVTVLEGVG